MPLGNNQLLEDPFFSAFAFHVRRAVGPICSSLQLLISEKFGND